MGHVRLLTVFLITVSETGYELDRTETFLPRDTIYLYKAKK